MKLIYYTNIFDDQRKNQRQAEKIAMAASRKILSFYDAMLEHSNIFNKDNLHIISLGITNIHNSIRIFKPCKVTDRGYTIHFGVFIRLKIVRDIFSIFWAATKTIRLVKRNDVVIFYGWSSQYLLSLLICRIIRSKCVLDIEDGPPDKISSISTLIQITLFHIYNTLCKDGTVAAANNLLCYSKSKNQLTFYPVSKRYEMKKNYDSHICQIHFGGSLMKDTGLELLVETIEKLNQQKSISKNYKFLITGYLSEQNNYRKRLEQIDNVELLGNISFKQLSKELEKCIIGLSLKLPGTRFGNTTFPSKVVDIISRAMLLITTDISDIREIYGNSVLYIEKIHPKILCDIIININNDRVRLKKMAVEAKQISDNILSPNNTVIKWENFVGKF